MWAKMNDQIGFESWAKSQMIDVTTTEAAVQSGASRATAPDRAELVRRLAIEQESSQWIVRQWGAALEAKQDAEKACARLVEVKGRWERCCYGLILVCVLIFCWAVSR